MATERDSLRAAKLRRLLIDLSIMVAIGIGLALLGPFGSYALSFAERLVNWTLLSLAGYCCYLPITSALVRLARSIDFPEPLAWIFAVVIATVPMTVIVWVVARILGDATIPDFAMAAEMYFNVLVVGGMITLFFRLVEGRVSAASMEQRAGGNTVTANAPIDESAKARFLDRLSPELGTDLIALEMEDHYVRAHTALGSELVLMRLRDAVAELDGIAGEQVHRSWWVARGALRDVKRDGRNIRLLLDNGVEAPVSRANVTPLKNAGWF